MFSSGISCSRKHLQCHFYGVCLFICLFVWCCNLEQNNMEQATKHILCNMPRLEMKITWQNVYHAFALSKRKFSVCCVVCLLLLSSRTHINIYINFKHWCNSNARFKSPNKCGTQVNGVISERFQKWDRVQCALVHLSIETYRVGLENFHIVLHGIVHITLDQWPINSNVVLHFANIQLHYFTLIQCDVQWLMRACSRTNTVYQ